MSVDTGRGSNTFLGSCWNSEKFRRRDQFPETPSDIFSLLLHPPYCTAVGACQKTAPAKGKKRAQEICCGWNHQHLQSCAPTGDPAEPYQLWGSCQVLWGHTPAAMRLPMAVRPARLVRRAEASVSVYQFCIFIFSKYLVQTNWPSIVWERWGTGWESFGWDCASSDWWL